MVFLIRIYEILGEKRIQKWLIFASEIHFSRSNPVNILLQIKRIFECGIGMGWNAPD